MYASCCDYIHSRISLEIGLSSIYASHIQPHKEVSPGYCMRISTGAPLPPGADSVVQVEDTMLQKATEDGKTELEIKIMVPPKKGQDIRQVE